MPPEPSSPRRRYGLLAALVAAAVAVTAGVALFAPDPEPAPPEPQPASVRWNATVNQVAFADERHGWALTPRCAAPTRCEPRFWRTLDGGGTWQQAVLPTDDLGRDTGVQLVAVGPRTIVVEAGRRRWLSTDSGETWRRGLALDALRAPAAPPTGVRLRTTSGTRPDPGQKIRPPRLLAWYALDSGQPTAFPDQPAWQPISVSAGPDGSIWAAGGNAQVAVWNGRWQAVTPALPPPPRTFVQVAAVDRRTAYLLVFGADDDSLLRPTAVSLTTDGGRTWRLHSLRGSTLRGSRDAAAVRGRLVVVDSSGGARVLVPAPKLTAPYAVEDGPALWSLDSTGGRLLGTGVQDGRYWTTTDGETWTELRLPA
ncbi:hypothetical protein [Cryptosporangium minutisporangium]|uniref:Exo-alpha-sialidase n=1 Tax=Cryptosporangium minutisporangium TaxID=113569 RepID=A0ABP6SUJ4_9ACTN